MGISKKREVIVWRFLIRGDKILWDWEIKVLIIYVKIGVWILLVYI